MQTAEREPANQCHRNAQSLVAACVGFALVFGCSGADNSGDTPHAANSAGGTDGKGSTGTTSGATGATTSTGGIQGSGGAAVQGGTNNTGGRSTALGGSASGGAAQTGGNQPAGGSPATGGNSQSPGGANGSGATTTGGKATAGGAVATGGTSNAGGANATGGAGAVGGSSGSAGKAATGGTTSAGGSAARGGTGGVSGPTSYTATWTSVNQHPPAAEWFQDAKFGLWAHWGAFSVPAFGSEWYPRNMFNKSGNSSEYQHHLSVFGDPFGNWGYDKFLTGANNKAGVLTQFAPKLKSEGGNFDPDEWAQLFADAGAKMAGPVAEHHDGFSMWNSACNEWNSVSKGPKLDLVGLFAKAYRAKGMKFLVSTHTAYNYNGYFQWAPAQTDASFKKLYGQLTKAEEEALLLCKEKELIDGYQPDYMWHDFPWANVSDATKLGYLSYYYNKAVAWGKEVVVSYNDGFNTQGEVHQVERGGNANIVTPFWLSEDTISSTTWGYTQGMVYYSAKSLLHALIDRVSKNGCLLLNISPMADGTIPQAQRDILLAMGGWLKIFGESIYSTRAWTKFGEGPTAMGGGGMGAPVSGTATDIRFTRSKDNKVLYAIGMGWPSSNQMVMTSLKSSSFNLATVTDISFIGGSTCTYTQDTTGLKISLPANLSNANGYAVKLTFSGTIPAVN